MSTRTARARGGLHPYPPALWATGLLVCWLFATALGLVGCARATDQATLDSAEVARSNVERGPVRLTVEIKPKKARLSDELTLTLSIDAERGVSVRKPPFGDSLGDFLVRDFREPLPKIVGDRERIEQVYTLEPTTTGTLRIQPISVTFTDGRSTGDGKEHTIESEGLAIEIESALTTPFPSLAELHPAQGPIELPAPGWPLSYGLTTLLGVLACVATFAYWRWRRRRRAAQAPRPLTPAELAQLEFERLLANGLLDSDVKQFYVELTAIVRRYLERTTSVHAPEQTTEEFLREIGNHPSFSMSQRDRLRNFLESADLVKFAAYQPGTSAIDESVRRAKIFVGLERESDA